MDEVVIQQPRQGKQGGRGDELDLGEILRLFLRHKYLLVFLVVTAIVTACLEHVSFPSYRVTASISVQNSDNSYTEALSSRLSNGVTGIMSGENLHEVPDKYFEIIGSFEFNIEVAKALSASPLFPKLNRELFLRKSLVETVRHQVKKALFHVDEDAEFKMSDESLAAVVGRWIGFRKSGMNIIVTVTTSDPELSLMLVNLTAETAVKYITTHELKDLTDGEKYLKNQLEEAEKEIRDTDNAITDFKRNNQLLSMDSAEGDSRSIAGELRRQIEDVELTLAENARLLQRLGNQRRLEESTLSNADLAANTRSKFGLGRKIQDLERENQVLEARRITVRRMLEELLRSQDPNVEQRIFDLRKKVELQYALYQELKKQSFQLEMERISVQNRVRYFERAREFTVHRSLSLNRKVLIAVVIAFVIGGFGAYLWELLVPRIKNRYDLDDLNTIYLGSIPDMSRVPSSQRVSVHGVTNKKGKVDKAAAILCRFDVDSPAAMSFKHIRTRILHLSERSGAVDQVISVHSAQMGEGKTFLASNLAGCIAHLKRKVLIIDCDLRRGTTSEIFHVKNATGLSEVLSGEEKFGTVVRRNVLPLLDLLPSGHSPVDATEMIASGRFTELLQDLRTVYDYIILDTPPVILVPDAGLIAQQADLVVMLADANNTTKENLSTAVEIILNLKQKRIHSVLNRAEGARQDYVYVVPERVIEARVPRTSAGPPKQPG